MIDRKSLEKSYWTLTEIQQNASVLNPVRMSVTILYHFALVFISQFHVA